MKNNLYTLALCLLLMACGHTKEKDPYPCDNVNTVDDARPDILVIGDSISIGYTPFVQAALPGYDVSHNYCNAMDSKNGVNKIDLWLSQRPSWGAITFNHGLWDVASWIRTSDSNYRANLTSLARKIKASTTKPLFILTTEIPINTPYRSNARALELNAIALDVMNTEGVPVLD